LGSGIEQHGLQYGWGVGVTGSVHAGLFYGGATILAHEGDHQEIDWGSTALYGESAQEYDSRERGHDAREPEHERRVRQRFNG
jgi:hypothetical protein